MPNKLLATLAATAFILTGCGASTGATDAAAPAATSDTAPSTSTPPPADSPTPHAEPVNTVHALGETVDTPGGSSVTAYDYRVITTPGDEREGVLEVKVCIGPPEEGYSGGSVLTDFWSIEDGEDRRFQPASAYGENDEVSPILEFETIVNWNDCLRGWIVMDTDDSTDAQTIRYYNSMSEDPASEEIRWEIA